MKDKKLPATIPINSTLPLAQSSGLVSRGLLAVRQSLAVADKNDAEAFFKEGIRFFKQMRFYNGEDGTPQDIDKARPYFLAAAKLNHAEAQFELYGLLMYEDQLPEAVAWLEKSVSLGFGPAQAHLAENLSDPLLAGHLTKSYDESELYRQSSVWYEQHANAGDAIAQCEFALMLRNQDVPIYGAEKAMRWIKAAAEQNHRFACRRLGEWLLDDKDPQHNIEQGIYWLSQAAKLGDSCACKSLGDLYLFGHAGGRRARGSFAKLIAPINALPSRGTSAESTLKSNVALSWAQVRSHVCISLEISSTKTWFSLSGCSWTPQTQDISTRRDY